MKRLLIRDGTERATGGLDFDLGDVLGSLGGRVAASQWRIPNLNYISHDDKSIPAFEGVGPVRGVELLGALPALMQVIDGELVGSEGDEKPWVVVRAIDSSWWEILSDDPSVISAIRQRFRNVEEQDGEPAA